MNPGMLSSLGTKITEQRLIVRSITMALELFCRRGWYTNQSKMSGKPISRNMPALTTNVAFSENDSAIEVGTKRKSHCCTFLLNELILFIFHLGIFCSVSQVAASATC
jgi:hypothetical protein